VKTETKKGSMTITKERLTAAFNTIVAVANTIRELGQVSSGVLYAQLMGVMDLETFTALIRTLKNTGLVTEENYLLTWVGSKESV